MAVAEAKQEPDNVVELPVAPKKRSRRKLVRLETDNAYVRAPIMNIATDVPGTVANVVNGL